MTAPYTPAVVNTIRKNAGLVPPQTIADVLGWSATQLDRIAKRHNIDLRAQIADRDDGAPVLATVARVRLPARRSEHFSVRLRASDAEIIRAKATARFTNPSALLALLIEGAIARGKVDDLVGAAAFYPRGRT